MAPKEEDSENNNIPIGNSNTPGIPMPIPITETETQKLKCDYLVVGAGTAGMSFIDTMLTEHPSSTIILVDRNSQPGGHWVHAYPYVRLHQASCYYGVDSLPLGKNLDAKGNERWDVNDRATGAEVVDYYKRACDNFVASGRVRCFFDAEHELDETTGMNTILVKGGVIGNTNNNNNSINNNNNSNSNSNNNNKSNNLFSVKCHKLVTVTTNVTVPSMRKPLIPVCESVSANFVPPNEVPFRAKNGNYNNYVVFGNGKTGVDTIAHLLLHEGIDQSQITWIVSRDAWYMLGGFLNEFYDFIRALGEMALAKSVNEYFLNHEEKGLLGRIHNPNNDNNDHQPFPEVFKGAVLQPKEFEAAKSIQNVVRMGRATSIESNRILLENGSIELFTPQTTLLVDCMVDNYYGYDGDLLSEHFQIFEPGRINMGPLLATFNPSHTSARIAFYECAFGGYDGDDSPKNASCYFLRGNHSAISRPESFFGQIYMEFKNDNALMQVKGGPKFVMNSRTWMMNPMHHKGGLPRFLWMMYGPSQGHKVAENFFQKIESKEYFDIEHSFGIETLNAERAQRKEKKKQSNPFKSFLR